MSTHEFAEQEGSNGLTCEICVKGRYHANHTRVPHRGDRFRHVSMLRQCTTAPLSDDANLAIRIVTGTRVSGGEILVYHTAVEDWARGDHTGNFYFRLRDVQKAVRVWLAKAEP